LLSDLTMFVGTSMPGCMGSGAAAGMSFDIQTRPMPCAALAVAIMNPRNGGGCAGVGGVSPVGSQTRPLRRDVRPDATDQRSGGEADCDGTGNDPSRTEPRCLVCPPKMGRKVEAGGCPICGPQTAGRQRCLSSDLTIVVGASSPSWTGCGIAAGISLGSQTRPLPRLWAVGRVDAWTIGR
jgi:hypothetical protein